MKLNILLTIAAIYMGLVGLGLIFGGSPLLGIAVLNWQTRNAEPSAARDAVILGNIVGLAVIAALVRSRVGGPHTGHSL